MGHDVLKVVAIGGVARIGFIVGLLVMSFSYKAVKPPSSLRTADYEEPPGGAPGTAKTLKSSQVGSHDVEAAAPSPVAHTAQVAPEYESAAAPEHLEPAPEAPHLDDPKTEFTFVDVAYVIPKVPFPKKPEKQILHSISATVKAYAAPSERTVSAAPLPVRTPLLSRDPALDARCGAEAMCWRSLGRRARGRPFF